MKGQLMTYGTRRRIIFQSGNVQNIWVEAAAARVEQKVQRVALFSVSEKLQFLIRNSIPQEIDVQMFSISSFTLRRKTEKNCF